METDRDPPRYSRKWFGEIFFTCWGCLVLVKGALDVFGWERGGLLYWLVEGPLVAGYVGAGVPWVFLGARDLVRDRRRVWSESRPWIFAAVLALAVVFAIAGVQWLVD